MGMTIVNKSLNYSPFDAIAVPFLAGVIRPLLAIPPPSVHSLTFQEARCMLCRTPSTKVGGVKKNFSLNISELVETIGGENRRRERNNPPVHRYVASPI